MDKSSHLKYHSFLYDGIMHPCPTFFDDLYCALINISLCTMDMIHSCEIIAVHIFPCSWWLCVKHTTSNDILSERNIVFSSGKERVHLFHPGGSFYNSCLHNWSSHELHNCKCTVHLKKNVLRNGSCFVMFCCGYTVIHFAISYMIAPVQQCWRILVINSHESTKN